MKLTAYLERRRRFVNRALERHLPADATRPQTLLRAMRYSLFSGGKRLRPLLMLATADAVGGERRVVLPFACGLEMLHTYSLIHDDLPAIDDDDLRRGRATCHVVFGEAVAILAGDALLNEAYHVMAVAALADGVNKARALRAMREIAAAAGNRGMMGGEVADIEAERTEPDLATVEFIHVRKTGALLLASIRAGAILSGAPARALQRLTRYGECLGLAFQIADDILDAEGATAVTGKRRGRDEALQKATFPAVVGIPAARERAHELLGLAIEALAPFDRRAEPLRQIARYVVTRAGGP